MIVENIADLLYRYDCVIVPNFGGFICSETSATLDEITHTFTPPTKKITFNKYLSENDGLLANYIAKQNKITYDEAMLKIEETISEWNSSIKAGTLELSGIGSFSLDQNENLVFEPSNDINYLRSSFGLSSFVSPPIKREEEKVVEEKPVIKLPRAEKVEEKEATPTNYKTYIKYAAGIALLFGLYSAGNYFYEEKELETEFADSSKQQENIEKKIQEATFYVGNPLPAITLNIGLKPKAETLNYHIVAGSFRQMKNADKKINELSKKGFSAKVIGKNKWDLIQVAFASFKTKEEALTTLNKIKKEGYKDAWLLTKKIES
ncbi:SPOR domain-containing protein [Aureivirga sp. CE67]|uniref:HU domain-containing protein n=1 Tax=Aureivirga sp. CE67 TaxID=1788983 RepID=UPI0018C97265|nr:SPOR domain-containing protein [Aureivirga sp. CE67]